MRPHGRPRIQTKPSKVARPPRSAPGWPAKKILQKYLHFGRGLVKTGCVVFRNVLQVFGFTQSPLGRFNSSRPSLRDGCDVVILFLFALE
jgi:hypothetical protein